MLPWQITIRPHSSKPHVVYGVRNAAILRCPHRASAGPTPCDLHCFVTALCTMRLAVNNPRSFVIRASPCDPLSPVVAGKETKFINCRIWPFWRAVWLVIWAVQKRIFQLLAGSRDDYQVSSAGGGGNALHLFHSERTPASSFCRIGGPQTRTWRHCLHRSTPRLSSKDH